MATVKMIARTALLHEGKRLQPGEAFTTSAVQGAILHYRHQAAFAVQRIGQSQRQDLTAEHPAAEAPPRKQKVYKRRDVTPESVVPEPEE